MKDLDHWSPFQANTGLVSPTSGSIGGGVNRADSFVIQDLLSINEFPQGDTRRVFPTSKVVKLLFSGITHNMLVLLVVQGAQAVRDDLEIQVAFKNTFKLQRYRRKEEAVRYEVVED